MEINILSYWLEVSRRAVFFSPPHSSVVLGAVLEDAGELDVVELAVLDGRLLEEIVDLVAAEPLPHRHQDVPQVVLGQTPCERRRERWKRVVTHVCSVRILRLRVKLLIRLLPSFL